MTDITITAHTRLTEDELGEVEALAEAVRAIGIDPRLNIEWLGRRDGSRLADWLVRANGRLVGAAATESFGDTVEATLLMAPDAPEEVAGALFDTLVRDLPGQGVRRLLFLHDRAAEPLRRLAEARQLTLDHAEIMMRRPAELGTVSLPVSTELVVREATEQDYPAAAELLAGEWGGDLAEVLVRIQEGAARGNTLYYVAALAGEPVAVLNVQQLAGQPWIYGFVVRQAFRGRGLGRQIMLIVLNMILADQPVDIFLEADPYNPPAVNLYQSLGFATMRTFDYWAKELADDTVS
jgi:ribosomal protein S18 acetylase RimI-like enzyme